MASASPVVAENTPDLEPRDGMFDPGPSTTVSAPAGITHDSDPIEHRRDELGDATVATIGQDTSMVLAQSFDRRASVMERVVAIAGTTCRDRDDAEVAATHQDLRVARPPVILGPGSARMVAGRNQGAIDGPRPSTIARHLRCELGEPRRDRRNDAV